MAVAWRITCLILLMVASFQLATIVQAQTDYSFGRWLEASGRLEAGERMEVEAEAAERGTSVEAVWANKKRRGLGRGLGRIIHQGYLEQYEKDKAEAAERGISFDAVFAERARAQELAQAAREKRQAIHLAVAATIAIAAIVIVFVIVFKARRRIAATISRRWRRKSKAFRIWIFSSFFWAIGTLFYLWLADPDWLHHRTAYRGKVVAGDKFVGLMIVPPLFLGAMWFGYKRFVDLQVKAEPQRVISDGDDTEDREA